MLCSVCHQKLAESEIGRKAHMARYHSVLAVAPKPTGTYKPMDPKEKAEKVRRMEMRLAGKVVLDDQDELLKYGEIAVKREEPSELVLADGSAIDDAKLDLGEGNVQARLAKVTEPVQGLGSPSVTPEPGIENPIKSWEEFNLRLDALVLKSDDVLLQMKRVFGE